jgi:hypothetical protein
VLVEAWHMEATPGVALGVSSCCALVAAVASSLASQPGDWYENIPNLVLKYPKYATRVKDSVSSEVNKGWSSL